MPVCPKCNSQNRENSKFCSLCGYILSKKEENIIGNRYKIEKLIKKGGMGAIYKGKHIKLNEICAIKEMLFTSNNNQENQYSMKRFYEEAKLLSRLRHPNLPVVTDYFDEYGKYYIIMDFIEGEDLETIIKKHGNPGLPENQVLKWIKDILTVLDYLHSQNPPIIYRDIKPSNMIIKNSDKKVMLVDFGIARRVQGNVYSGQTAIGTFGYAPIEQYRGAVEPRSDIYALGATIHYLLSGLEPRSCDFKLLREINPSISIETEEIVNKALKEKIEDRFSSAIEMLMAVEKIYKKQDSSPLKDHPSNKISIANKVKYNLNSCRLYRNSLEEKQTIKNIKNIINIWGNQESWFTKDFGKRIEIVKVFQENAFIISIEILFIERYVNEGIEPYSEDIKEQLNFRKTNYKSLEEFPLVSPPEGFTTKFDENYIFPDSKHICNCTKCRGTGNIICSLCKGKGINIKSKAHSTCNLCRGTGKSICNICNGYKKIIKYLYFSTKYYPMYVNDIIYNGRFNRKMIFDSQKNLLYKENIFDYNKTKILETNKILDIQNTIFEEDFNKLIDKIRGYNTDTQKKLKTPIYINLSVEEIIIKELQFKNNNKINTLWIYGNGTQDRVFLENRPILWATEEILDGVKNFFKGKR